MLRLQAGAVLAGLALPTGLSGAVVATETFGTSGERTCFGKTRVLMKGMDLEWIDIACIPPRGSSCTFSEPDVFDWISIGIDSIFAMDSCC